MQADVFDRVFEHLRPLVFRDALGLVQQVQHRHAIGLPDDLHPRDCHDDRGHNGGSKCDREPATSGTQ